MVGRLLDKLETSPSWQLHALLRACALTCQPHVILTMGLDPSIYKQDLPGQAIQDTVQTPAQKHSLKDPLYASQDGPPNEKPRRSTQTAGQLRGDSPVDALPSSAPGPIQQPPQQLEHAEQATPATSGHLTMTEKTHYAATTATCTQGMHFIIEAVKSELMESACLL